MKETEIFMFCKTKNLDIKATFAFLVLVILLSAFDAFPQSTYKVFRKCPGASPSPTQVKVEVEADGDVLIQNCTGRSTTINGTFNLANTSFAVGNGSAAAPTYSFSSDTNTGMYRAAADALGFSFGGSEVMVLGPASINLSANLVSTAAGTFGGIVTGPVGSAASPTFTFAGDTNTGMYRAGADIIGFSTNGSAQATLSSTGQLSVLGGVSTTTGSFTGAVSGNQNGTVAAPAFTFLTDTNTGMYRNAADDLGFAVGGSRFLSLATSTSTFGDVDGNAASKVISINQAGNIVVNAQLSNVALTAAQLSLTNVTDGVTLDRTITAAGTTGNQTINDMAGTVNFAAAATALTVTNALVTTSSIIVVTARTNDATCTVKNYVPAAGSFVINMTAACTAETSVGFVVTN